jgi:hypothetical protein
MSRKLGLPVSLSHLLGIGGIGALGARLAAAKAKKRVAGAPAKRPIGAVVRRQRAQFDFSHLASSRAIFENWTPRTPAAKRTPAPSSAGARLDEAMQREAARIEERGAVARFNRNSAGVRGHDDPGPKGARAR